MIVRSLRWRLLLGAAAAIGLALLLAWLFMTVLFERHLERRLQAEMTRDGLRLVASLSVATDGTLAVASPPLDARLDTPAGGYYWEVIGAGNTLRSRSLWDADLAATPTPPATTWRMQRVAGPYGQTLYQLERSIRPQMQGAPVRIQLAQDVTPLSAARAQFGRELAAFLAVLWLVLSAAAWVQVQLGLRPLARIGAQLATLRASAAARLPVSAVSEVRPLVDSINALADAREHDLGVARQRAADLAHSLKTPLAAMAAQSRRARDSGAEVAADGLDRAIAAIKRAIDAELARARIAMIRRQPGGDALVRAIVERVLTVLEHTDRGGELAFSLDVPDSLRLAIQTDDLAEILGALLENAVRYARRQVRISAAAGPQWTTLDIEDDGPGLARESMDAALQRGTRLDESTPGSGLGLAIAGELVAASGGSISLAPSDMGGLKVSLAWTSPTP